MTDTPQRVRVAYADDEPLGRATLRALLEEDGGVEIVAECKNGHEALEAVRRERPDVLFLDIQMPGMTGLEVAEELEEEDPPVIVFATAFDHFALSAFDLHAADYLLKPFDDDRFRVALSRAKKRVELETGESLRGQLSDILSTLHEKHSPAGADEVLTRLSIHREGRVDVVHAEELIWVEAADQYVMLHTERGDFLMRESMGKLERGLDPDRFLRTHRSAIVAVDQVRALERNPGGVGRVQLTSGTWLPVSRSRMSAVRARVGGA